MKLTKEQQQIITSKINEKWAKPIACPTCKANSWNISDNVFELRDFNYGNMVIGGVPIIPIVPVICHNCGNTILVNPLILGVELKEDSSAERK